MSQIELQREVFVRKLRGLIENLVAQTMEAHAEEHYHGQLPVDEFAMLMHRSAFVLAETMLKNVLFVAAFEGKPDLGYAMMKSLNEDWEAEVQNLPETKEKLVELLTLTTERHNVH